MILDAKFEELESHCQGVVTLTQKHPLLLDKHQEFISFHPAQHLLEQMKNSFCRSDLIRLYVKVALGERG
jgi:hypothetical protein